MANRSNRIDLSWGDGGFSVILDIRNGELYPYSSKEAAQELHERLGGNNYYVSNSGASGAGWCPNRPYLYVLGTYRVDVTLPTMAGSFWLPEGEHDVYAPIVYRGNRIADEYPVIRKRAGSPPIMLPISQAVSLVIGDVDDCGDVERRDYQFSVIRSPGGEPEIVETPVYVSARRTRLPGLGRAVKALEYNKLAFQWPDDSSESFNPPHCARWFARLGLYTFGGDYAYKVAGGICYSRLVLDEPDSEARRPDSKKMAELQAIAPNNAAFLAINVYLQGPDADGYEAVGVFDCSEQAGADGPDSYYDYEIRLSKAEALRAMAGWGDDRESIFRRLREGAEAKASSDREQVARRAAGRQEAAAAAEKYGDVIVTVADSVAAGNCEVGTRDFASRHFPGKDSVKLSELAPFADNRDVARVIRAVADREAQRARDTAEEVHLDLTKTE